MSTFPVKLHRREDLRFVDAEILDGLALQDLMLIEKQWRPERSRIHQELKRRTIDRSIWPQSLHWSWETKAARLTLLETSVFCVVCESLYQGAMLTKAASYSARLPREKSMPLLYVDYLEVAPWNWSIPEIGRSGRFRMIGSLLIWKAITHSSSEGFGGRIGLHSLPQAENFYEKLGMTPLGPDPNKQGLVYFELSSPAAQVILNGSLRRERHQ